MANVTNVWKQVYIFGKCYCDVHYIMLTSRRWHHTFKKKRKQIWDKHIGLTNLFSDNESHDMRGNQNWSQRDVQFENCWAQFNFVDSQSAQVSK